MEITYLTTEESVAPVSDLGLTATDEDVLAPYKYIGYDGVESVGKMPNNGTVSVLLTAGDVYSIPKGYHSGLGSISSVSLFNLTIATATKDKVVNGKTVWVNGEEITGELNLGLSEDIPEEISYSSPSLYVYIKSGAYQNSSNFVNIQNSDLLNELGIDTSFIAQGSSVFGVAGSYTADATVIASVVRKGKTIYANGKKLTGTLEIPTLF